MVKKVALLVGCNYPGTKAKLSGCVNDVQMMKKLLIEKKGFEAKNIKVMVDTTEKDFPKKKNILASLTKMCSNCEPGDSVVFHFSGHGCRVKTDDPDEDDKKDECIIAANMKPIRDDQLKNCVDKLPDGVNFTMIADCCHSGGMLDHKEVLIDGDKSKGDGNLPSLEDLQLSDNDDDDDKDVQARKIEEGVLVEEQEKRAKAKGKERKDKQRTKYKRGASRDIGVLVTGCRAEEKSADCRSGKKSYGAMTNTLNKVVRKYPKMNSYEVVKHLRKEMQVKGYKQNPCLECDPSLASKPFICG